MTLNFGPIVENRIALMTIHLCRNRVIDRRLCYSSERTHTVLSLAHRSETGSFVSRDPTNSLFGQPQVCAVRLCAGIGTQLDQCPLSCRS